MSFIDSWPFLMLMCGAYAAASYADIRSSIPFPDYGGLEGISLRRDKYGYFSMTKEFVISGCLLAIAAGLHPFEPKSWVILIGGIVGRLAIAFSNSAKNRASRDWQIKWLDSLAKQDPDNYEAFVNFFPSQRIERKFVDGRLWVPLYAKLATGWLYEQAAGIDDYEALYRLTKRIWLIAQLPNEKRFA